MIYHIIKGIRKQEDGNLYLRPRTMSHTIYAAKFEQTITHQHILLRQESQSY
jgi:hypothetical protein